MPQIYHQQRVRRCASGDVPAEQSALKEINPTRGGWGLASGSEVSTSHVESTETLPSCHSQYITRADAKYPCRLLYVRTPGHASFADCS